MLFSGSGQNEDLTTSHLASVQVASVQGTVTPDIRTEEEVSRGRITVSDTTWCGVANGIVRNAAETASTDIVDIVVEV